MEKSCRAGWVMRAKGVSSMSPKPPSAILGKAGGSAQSRLLLNLALVCLPWNVMPNPAAHGSRSSSQKNHSKGAKHNLHPKGPLTCLPEQGATPGDCKSSSDRAAGTGAVWGDQQVLRFSTAPREKGTKPMESSAGHWERKHVRSYPQRVHFFFSSQHRWRVPVGAAAPSPGPGRGIWVAGARRGARLRGRGGFAAAKAAAGRDGGGRERRVGALASVSWPGASGTEVEKSFVTRIKAKYIALGEM